MRREASRRLLLPPDGITITAPIARQELLASVAVTGEPPKRPDADDDARAWNPRPTCRGCRPTYVARWARPDRMSALARFADSSRTSREVREVPYPAVSNRSKQLYSITSLARARTAPPGRWPIGRSERALRTL